MQNSRIYLLIVAIMAAMASRADDLTPTIDPIATFITPDGEETGTSYSGNAPLIVRFQAGAQNTDGWTTYYEWRFMLEGKDEPYLLRHEEDTEYTFQQAGSHRVVLYAIFTQAGDTVAYTDEYWADAEPITIQISESKLEMPNAFTPNGDGINDIYKAKDGYQSIIDFHAYIYNRWGQKLFEWTDPSQGWDGKYKGKDVKQGVYFVLVKAKGADGRTFNIKRDVNLLRGYTETSGATDE